MSAHHSPPKRPRLSLQIKAISEGPSIRASRTIAAAVDVKSPTAFNTLSNVYVTAIDRRAGSIEPVTAINTRQPLKIQTENVDKEPRLQTPHVAAYPETPLTAQPLSPAVAMEMNFPSTMTATPPLSAGPTEPNGAQAFTFSVQDTSNRPEVVTSPRSPRTLRRRSTCPPSGSASRPPYTRTRGIHSILRNSPLPPSSAKTPISPRRQSLRLQEKAARRVGYNSPLTQTITTNKYTKSHIDLLVEEASPYSSTPTSEDNPEMVLDLTLAYTGDETRDGGQTPGPFEEMRRRMAGLATNTPISPAGGVRKRKRKEKEKDRKRRWVWTIGQDDDDENVGGALAAIRAAAGGEISKSDPQNTPVTAVPSTALSIQPTVYVNSPMDIPTPSIEAADHDAAFQKALEVTMSEASNNVSEVADRAFTPGDMDVDMITPTVPRKRLPSADPAHQHLLRSERQDSLDLFNPETGSRRDTPVPADMLLAAQT
ncbi:Glucan 4-alpha-glucosidase-like protein [Pleurostoma richardsiae]|uniref:Glucan 4-alpha-glucosidase-like protein n=1 Tax=Pleurostoma richardsiae TaxID=41990 RepID=A0AA38RVK6_9PEZI|nr:Glucan 4-alpha-glucosidase-like protein [Pleurostoma richardsiae]